jgi:methyl-accepting chemotaxis protein
MSTAKYPHRRSWTGILINPQFQMRYFLWITFVGTSIVVTYSVVIYIFFMRGEIADFPMDERGFSNPMDVMGLVSLGFVLMIALVAAVLSHRTAGALFHFKKVFNGIKAGDHTLRIRLRKNDDFKDVAAAFNEMMDELQKSSKS